MFGDKYLEKIEYFERSFVPSTWRDYFSTVSWKLLAQISAEKHVFPRLFWVLCAKYLEKKRVPSIFFAKNLPVP